MSDRKKEHINDEQVSAAVRERRIAQRTPVDAPVEFQILVEGGKGEMEDGRLLDLSIAGAAILTSRELASGALLRLGIPAADPSSPRLQIRGAIVNRRQLEDGHWRYGMKFDKIYYTLAKRAIELATDQAEPDPEIPSSKKQPPA